MVIFDGSNKTITVTTVTLVNVMSDIYSAWKRWCIVTNNLKYPQALRPVGGDDIGGGNGAPQFFFLMNNWKVVVDGVIVTFQYNLYCEAATNTTTLPFVYLNGGSSNNSLSTAPVVTITANSGSGLSTAQAAELKSAYLALIGDRSQDDNTGVVVVYEEDGITPRHTIQAYKNGTPSKLSEADTLKGIN